MSLPILSPTSQTSAIILPVTGNTANVAGALPLGVYVDSTEFLSGAAAQVAFTYKRLGGDVLDIELTEQNVYANFEDAVLEYSYLINIHQSKNIVGSALGGSTGSFNHRGQISTGHSLSGSNIALRYPKFSFETSFRIGDTFATEAGVGGTQQIYSASITTVSKQQDYDLQAILEADSKYGSIVGKKRVKIRDVFYVSAQQMWRFYGYYGGLNVVGNMSTYGQYADDSSFQVIPSWQNKIQAIAYEDHLYTRTSHYSYEVIDNKLRLYPTPSTVSPEKFWFRFTVDGSDIWDDTKDNGQKGINNMNTLPFENLPYENINSIGHQWIRRFALALSKETLGQIRGKFGGNVPIPGENITLNASDLLGQAKAEQDALRDELKTILDELTYPKLIASDKEMAENAKIIMTDVPNGIFVG
tara:strand:- start:9234 stop:10478 length:1245 start_codon:yes stop_codon:yes gene_type:complete